MTLADEIARRSPARSRRGDGWAIPTPGHSTRDRGTVIYPRPDGGVIVNSFNADWRAVRAALGLADEKPRPLTRPERRRLAAAKLRAEEARLRKAGALWQAGALPGIGGPVQTYLGVRGLSAATIALATRCGGAIREHCDERGRISMAVLARDGAGAGRAVQLTKLKRDGSGKRCEQIDRITFGLLRRAVVQLLEPQDAALAICEGVETALAFYQLHRIPAWAALGTANLAAFTPPAGVRRLYIAADSDAPGRAAAADLFERLRAKMRCTIAAAPEGQDWADVLAARKAGAP